MSKFDYIIEYIYKIDAVGAQLRWSRAAVESRQHSESIQRTCQSIPTVAKLHFLENPAVGTQV